MSCDNCKKVKKLKNDFEQSKTEFNNRILGAQNKIGSNLWDDSMGRLKPLEQIGVTLFGWIPMGVGYFVIVKFIISLF
tara:strand:- start:2468 stop:2701 length:234 start_codon:yes stop_codon:yes gene_type:complete